MFFGRGVGAGLLAAGKTFAGRAVVLGVVAASAIAPAEALAADNLAPVNTVPAAVSVNEDSILTLSGANAISVSDPDAGGSPIEVALTTTHGVLTLAGTSGLSFSLGDGASDPAMTFQGTITDLNTALAGTVYDSDLDYNGAAELSMTTNDLGNTGEPPAETDTDVVPITVNAVNDAPVNSLPATQTIDEDTTLTFSAANANLVSISDVDAGSLDLRMTVSTTPSGSFATGTITVTDREQLTFTSGDGVDDATMTFEGSLDEINAALDGMSYTPSRDLYGTSYGAGAGNLRFIINDLGNQPSPVKADTDELAIHINPVDTDAPTARIVAGIGTYQDVPEELSLASGNQLQVVDLDSNEQPTDELKVSLSSTHGTLSFDSTTGLDFTTGDGTGDTAIAFTGARSDITAAFDTGVTFTPDSGFTGTAQLTMDLEDLTSGQNPGPDHEVGDLEVDAPEETVYFTGSKITGTTLVPNVGGAIGRAELDGGGGVNLFGGPTLADIPQGIAIDLVDEKIYWSIWPTSQSKPQIYRANLDGSGSPEIFAQGNQAPTGTYMNTAPGALVVDQTTRRLYWSSTDVVPPIDLASKSISYVSLDGPVPATSGGTVAVTTGSGGGGPRYFALDLENARFFFGDTTGDAIGVTPTPGSTGTNSRFTVAGSAPSDPQGIAYDPGTNRLYWGNATGDPVDERIRYADLNGTTSITGQVFDNGISVGGGARGMALDPTANRLYWGLSSSGKIEYASLAGDGTDSGAIDLGDSNHTNLDGVTLLKDPEPLGSPTISGTLAVGQPLTCGEVTWAADLVSGALYRMAKSTQFGGWTLNGTPIPGASDPTYTPTAAGDYRCSREASNFAGTSTAESSPVTISAPGAVDDASSVAEDSGASAIDVTANDTGVPRTIVATSDAPHGTVQIAGGGSGLTYAPDADYCGTDTFTYTLTLGSTATVSITVTCADDVYDRSLTLRYKNRKQIFKGRLTSPEGDCATAKVVVFRKRAGADKRVGSDRTSPSGAWSVRELDAKGRFYATAAARTVAGGTCAGATSRTVKTVAARHEIDGTPHGLQRDMPAL